MKFIHNIIQTLNIQIALIQQEQERKKNEWLNRMIAIKDRMVMAKCEFIERNTSLPMNVRSVIEPIDDTIAKIESLIKQAKDGETPSV